MISMQEIEIPIQQFTSFINVISIVLIQRFSDVRSPNNIRIYIKFCTRKEEEINYFPSDDLIVFAS